MPSQIARCPICGKKPDLSMRHMTVFCCEVGAASLTSWNRYAKHSRKGQQMEHAERCYHHPLTQWSFVRSTVRAWWRAKRRK